MSKHPPRATRETVAYPALWTAAGQPPRQGVVCDLSEKGMFLRPVGVEPQSIPIGTPLRVQLVIDSPSGRSKLDISGVVRWCGTTRSHRSAGLGLEFEVVNGTPLASDAANPLVAILSRLGGTQGG